MLIAFINPKCLPDITFLILPNNPIRCVLSPFHKLGKASLRVIEQFAESVTGIQAKGCLALKLKYQMTSFYS